MSLETRIGLLAPFDGPHLSCPLFAHFATSEHPYHSAKVAGTDSLPLFHERVALSRCTHRRLTQSHPKLLIAAK
jgi:hypothetical protein